MSHNIIMSYYVFPYIFEFYTSLRKGACDLKKKKHPRKKTFITIFKMCLLCPLIYFLTSTAVRIGVMVVTAFLWIRTLVKLRQFKPRNQVGYVVRKWLIYVLVWCAIMTNVNREFDCRGKHLVIASHDWMHYGLLFWVPWMTIIV